jgi:hypothetical protein
MADTGDPLVLGQENTAPDPTVLEGRLLTTSIADNPSPGSLHPAVSGQNGGTGASQVGVYGQSNEYIGVFGESEGNLGPVCAGVYGLIKQDLGAGVAAISAPLDGTGLYVQGRVRLGTRSGRATVAAGKSFVDVNLIQKGRLAGTPLCFANLMSYRPGVFVTAVRPNYPVMGRMRIYLNRAVRYNTFVAWFVLN